MIIKIGGINYEAIKVNKPSNSDPMIDGLIDYANQEIRVSNDGSDDYIRGVFIHEIVHGLFEHMGWEQNEQDVEQLANALNMFVKDNPSVFSNKIMGV